jgi:SAM-dependent methyltransferase
MGLSKGALHLLLEEAARRPFEGNLATLGRQDVLCSYAELRAMARRHGLALHPTDATLHRKAELARQGFVSDDSLFHALGFAEVRRLDYSDYEGPDDLLDLNARGVPEHLQQRFDVVLDSGTIEHVFHLPHALENIFRMLKPGGRVIHISPSSNHIDHGFYMFSPTLFWDYYAANEFEINTFHLFRHVPYGDGWLVYDYTPGCLAPSVMWGGLDDAMYEIFVVATRTLASTGDRVPQQGWYLAKWHEAGTAPREGGAGGALAEPEGSKARRLLEWTRGSPTLRRWAWWAIDGWRAFINRRRARRKGLGLKPTARY